MGYTKGETYTQAENLTGPVTVANEQYYTEEVYAKTLKVDAELIITDVTVESGGSMSATSNTGTTLATFNSVTVGNGGKVTINNYNSASNFTVLSGGSLYTGNYVYLYNADIRSGAIWNKTNITYLGGRQTNIEKGVTYDGEKLGNDFFVSGGVIRNLDLKKQGSYSRLYIYDIIASGAKVSSGGSLYLAGGTTATSAVDTVVGNKGLFSLASGSGNRIYNTVVSSGGTLSLSTANHISGLTVKSGGSVTNCFTGAQKMYGRNYDIESGALVHGDTDVFTDESGAIHNIRVNTGAALHLIDAAAVDPKINGVLYASSGTYVKGYTTLDQTGVGGLVVFANAVCEDIQAISGNYVEINYSGAILGGANATVTDTTIQWCKDKHNTNVTDNEISIQNGVIANMKLISSGNWLKHITLDNGIRADAPVISSGGTLVLKDGGLANDLTLSATGRVIVSGGGAVDRLIQSGGTSYISGSVVAHSIFAGSMNVRNGGRISGVLQSGGSILVSDGGYISGAQVEKGTFHVSNGGVAENAVFMAGAATVFSGGSISGAAIRGGDVKLSSRSNATDVVLYDGTLTIYSSAKVSGLIDVHGGYANIGKSAIVYDGVTVHTGASARANTAVNVVESAWNMWVDTYGTVNAGDGVTLAELHVSGGAVNALSGAVVNGASVVAGELNVSSGATVADLDAAAGKVTFAKGALFQGAKTAFAEGTLFFGETAVAGHAENGVITGLDAGTAQFQLSVGDGIVVRDAVGNHTSVRISAFDGASIQGATMYKGAIICNDGASGTMEDVTLTGAGQMNLSGTARAERTVIENGGKLFVNAGTASFDNTILKAGGALNFNATGADTGKNLTLDYTGAATKTVTISWLDRIAASTTVLMKGIDEAGSYEINTSGGTLAKVNYEAGLYDGELTSGGASYTNGIAGLTYSFDGSKLTAADAGIATAELATKLTTSGTNINSGDLATKWDATTTYSTNVYLADGLTTGNAWLNIDGFDKAANIYGAAKDQNFVGVVNIGADNGTIKNLAAGAGLGGKVAGVKLTVGENMNVTGAVYAGGMGDVTGATETLIEGGSFAGNVFAGALCNYVANSTATATGDIALTVDGGRFQSNLYAGAAVKAGAATGVVHTAGDITVKLDDGTAAKGAFCVYGGGYATGTTTSKVYEADNVAITINGGAWGSYASGRGIFGGVYADKVAASVDKVTIAVTGGTMGNVYGGGWAQNGGTSTVTGAVNITISGDAAVNNVFGGGSYSMNGSQGATSVGSVNIAVAGGSITDNIFAGGQNEFSTVTGDVSVTFTGAKDYTCNVYGYGISESATEGRNKTLTFAGYTGTLSGDIGGFDGITFAGDTAATLSGATIANDDWTFDYTGRTLDADAVALTLNNGSFADDELTLKLAASAAPTDWSIAAGLSEIDLKSYAVYVGDTALEFAGGKVVSGDYEGWGFTLEDSTLKFKHLA